MFRTKTETRGLVLGKIAWVGQEDAGEDATLGRLRYWLHPSESAHGRPGGFLSLLGTRDIPERQPQHAGSTPWRMLTFSHSSGKVVHSSNSHG